MRRSAILIAGVIICTAASAQKITEKQLSFSGKESVVLNIGIADSIGIQTWNKNEVSVKASVNINDNKDNDAYEISFGEKDKSVIIKADFKKDYFKGKNNCCNTSDILWVVFLPENVPFSVETINANITINGKTDGMNVKTISGFIDLADSPVKKADLDLSTISGSIYTNYDLDLSGGHSDHSSGIKAKLNNGGALIKLATISGDIFLRKAD